MFVVVVVSGVEYVLRQLIFITTQMERKPACWATERGSNIRKIEMENHHKN